MFTNKDAVRKLIFGLFCSLIFLISIALTYHISILEGKDITHLTTPIKEENDCGNGQNFFVGSFYFKIMAAFFAGGMLSDRLFIRIGIF
jgi:hypothetical protein